MLTGISLQVCIIYLCHELLGYSAERLLGSSVEAGTNNTALSSSNYSSFAQLSDPQELERIHYWRYGGLQTIRPQKKHCIRV